MSHLMSLISRNGKTSWFKYIMSTSISIIAQIKSEDGSYRTITNKTKWYSYAIFAWLAGVRNDEHQIVPLSKPRGLPQDITDYIQKRRNEMQYGDNDPRDEILYSLFKCPPADAHSHSWFTLDELLNVDYQQIVEDRRNYELVLSENNSGSVPEGKGQFTSLKEYLGEAFMQDLDTLKQIGADRVLIAFVY